MQASFLFLFKNNPLRGGKLSQWIPIFYKIATLNSYLEKIASLVLSKIGRVIALAFLAPSFNMS